MESAYFVYLLSNWNHNVLYVGVTNDLRRRVIEHKQGLVPGFTQKYKCNCLVYYESTPYVNNALEREKEIKKWRREKKDALVESFNPEWLDLSSEADFARWSK